MFETQRTPPAIRLDSTYGALGSKPYAAALEAIEQGIAAIEQLGPVADEGQAGTALQLYENTLDELDGLFSFVRVVGAIDDASYEPTQASLRLHDLERQLNEAMISAIAYIRQPGDRSDAFRQRLEHAGYALRVLHPVWKEALDKQAHALMRQVRIVAFWPLTDSYSHLLKLIQVPITTEEKLPRILSFSQCMSRLRGNSSRFERKQVIDGLNERFSFFSANFADIFNAIEGIRLATYRMASVDYLSVSLQGGDLSRSALLCAMQALGLRAQALRIGVTRRAPYFGSPVLQAHDLVMGPPTERPRQFTAADAFGQIVEATTPVVPAFAGFINHLLEHHCIEMRPAFCKSADNFCVGFGARRTIGIVCRYQNDMASVFSLANLLGQAWLRHKLLTAPRLSRQISPLLVQTIGFFHEELCRSAWFEKAPAPLQRGLLWHHLRSMTTYCLNYPVRYDFECAFLRARHHAIVSVSQIKTFLSDAWKRWYGENTAEMDPSLWMSQRHFYDTFHFLDSYNATLAYLLAQLLVQEKESNPLTFAARYDVFLTHSTQHNVEQALQRAFGWDLSSIGLWTRATDCVTARARDWDSRVSHCRPHGH